MTAPNPLTTLLEHHERARDVARAEHARARSASDAAAVQAEQLHSYRREYEQRWSAQFSREGPIQLVTCYHSFMARLTQAVEQQALAVQLATQRCEHTLSALRGIELRCASVRTLIERRVQTQRHEADRRDQKQSDEHAMRAAWSRLNAAGQTRPL